MLINIKLLLSSQSTNPKDGVPTLNYMASCSIFNEESSSLGEIIMPGIPKIQDECLNGMQDNAPGTALTELSTPTGSDSINNSGAGVSYVYSVGPGSSGGVSGWVINKCELNWQNSSDSNSGGLVGCSVENNTGLAAGTEINAIAAYHP